jgi:hypothetical protein
MKKIVLAGLAALAVIALAQQQASAWVNARFGVGLNWQRQSGGNNLGWGLYRNGQPPGPEAFGGVFSPSNPAPPYFGGTPAPQTYPAHSAAPQGYAPQTVYYPPTEQYAPYHFASYPRPTTYYYYPAPAYYFYFYGE